MKLRWVGIVRSGGRGVLVSAFHKVSPLGGDPCCSGLVRAPADMALESEAEEVLFGFLICLGSQFTADSGPPTCAGHSQPVGPGGDVRAGSPFKCSLYLLTA